LIGYAIHLRQYVAFEVKTIDFMGNQKRQFPDIEKLSFMQLDSIFQ